MSRKDWFWFAVSIVGTLTVLGVLAVVCLGVFG